MRMQRIIVVGQILTLTLMTISLVRWSLDLGYLKPPGQQYNAAYASEVTTSGMVGVPAGGEASRSPPGETSPKRGSGARAGKSGTSSGAPVSDGRVSPENHGPFFQVGRICGVVWSRASGAALAVPHWLGLGWERLNGAWNVLLGKASATAKGRAISGAGARHAEPAFLPLKKVEMKKGTLVGESARRHAVRESAGRVKQYTNHGAAASAR